MTQKFTGEHLNILAAWEADVKDTIQAGLAGKSIMTSTEDRKAAKAVFNMLFRHGMLDLPEMPEADEYTSGQPVGFTRED
jgi:hypothetical protein